MAYNRMVIGGGRDKENKSGDGKEPKSGPKDSLSVLQKAITEAGPGSEAVPGLEPETEEIPIDEPVWGNDRKIIEQLDEAQLAERRHHVRVRYMRRIKCNTTFDDLESEPVSLLKPIVFTIIDVSVSGLGVISEEEISIGAILGFTLALDGMAYEIMCEVVYCFRNDDKYRAGLRVIQKDKQFIRHLKIMVARLSLQSAYGQQQNGEPEDS